MNLGLPRIILYLALVFIVAGIVLHGIAWSEFQRIWDHLSDRPSGSLALRFFLQPAMSAIVAVRDGIKDARTGRSPYFWTVLSDPQKRRDRLREGLDATGKIILIAIGLDAVYQYLTTRSFFPVEALLVAIILAFIPYFLLRGPVNRIAQGWLARNAGPAT